MKRVACSSAPLTKSPTKPLITAIYLAAGLSRRMGKPKLDLPFHGAPLGAHALRTLLDMDEIQHIFLIVRPDDPLDWLLPATHHPNFRVKTTLTPSPKAHLGQSHSLRSGILAAQTINADAALILLADQPFVSRDLLHELLQRYRHDYNQAISPHYVASCHKDILRPPILLTSNLFPNILELEGDEGARRLLKKGSWQGSLVDWKVERDFYDIDTEEAYLDLLQREFE
ncbi:MAG TPA: nucleotidyltransferase family protein [Bacilli bacterium]|nr:nucleotidyltransferase family protein [Bacilli bacterium]